MEKISGIVPSSSRVTSVDMKEASPVRPGTPGFGRAEVSPKTDRAAFDGGQNSIEAQKQMNDWKTKDQRHAEIARDLSDRFFSKNKHEVEDVNTVVQEHGVAVAYETAASPRVAVEDIEGAEQEAERGVSTPVRTQQPPGLYPKGSFVNYLA